jgi:hypothetical protein
LKAREERLTFITFLYLSPGASDESFFFSDSWEIPSEAYVCCVVRRRERIENLIKLIMDGILKECMVNLMRGE